MNRQRDFNVKIHVREMLLFCYPLKIIRNSDQKQVSVSFQEILV